MYTVTDPNLGEWGAGGTYGSQYVMYTFDDVARGTYGATYNGTGGLIPAALTAGTEYKATLSGELTAQISVPDNCKLNVLAIDGNTNRVLTAERVKLGDKSGVDDIVSDLDGDAVIIGADGRVIIAAAGEFTARVYGVDGALLATANGVDNAIVNVDATGIVIVRVTGAAGVTTAKVRI